jgi:nicotinamidase-related amidase
MAKATTAASFIPSFFNPKTVGEIRSSDYGAVASEAERLRGVLGIQPSATDRLRIALMPIDCQIGFCVPGQPLYVGGRSGTGAVDDTRRLCEFIFREAGNITDIYPTMDTHFAFQIFHPAFLVDAAGNHPQPFTQISLADIESGVWSVDPKAAYAVTGNPNGYVKLQEHLVHYARSLSKGSKFALSVWPYHCLLGGVDHALVPALHEAIVYHSLLRSTQVHPQIKGGNPMTENYSIFKPEVLAGADGRPIAQRNTLFMEALLKNDIVVIGGQAKSHCVAWSIDDFLSEILAKDPKLAEKVYLLDDASSPVVVPGILDFTDQAEEAYRRFAAAGMHIVSTTTPIRDWPGIDVSRMR